uniref:Uncharacterized protein n=2 Tax=Nothobranchius pienaari TaxID=704102 RepID=A0A1A8QD65_9TELE
MQRYAVKYRTVRYALHGTIRPPVPRDFGTPIDFALLSYFMLGTMRVCRSSQVVIPGLYDKTRKAIESDLAKAESLALAVELLGQRRAT